MIEKVCFFPYTFLRGELKFLLGTRHDGNFTAPTGHVEIGESYIDGLKREAKEELDLDHFRNIINTRKSFEFQTERGNFKEYVFALEIDPEVPDFEKAEFKQMDFYSIEQALASLTFDNHKKFIQLIHGMVLQKNYPKIFTISGPTGSGKGSLLASIHDTNFKRAKTVTTRTRRPGEGDEGRYFLGEKQFDDLDEKGEIIEKFRVHRQHWYGSLFSEVEGPLYNGVNVLEEIDINGVREYKKYFSNVVSIFIDVSIEELKSRVLKRNPDETEEEINRRLITAQQEQEFAKEADYVIENRQGELEKSVEKFKEILKKEAYE